MPLVQLTPFHPQQSTLDTVPCSTPSRRMHQVNTQLRCVSQPHLDPATHTLTPSYMLACMPPMAAPAGPAIMARPRSHPMARCPPLSFFRGFNDISMDAPDPYDSLIAPMIIPASGRSAPWWHPATSPTSVDLRFERPSWIAPHSLPPPGGRTDVCPKNLRHNCIPPAQPSKIFWGPNTQFYKHTHQLWPPLIRLQLKRTITFAPSNIKIKNGIRFL